MKDKRPITFLAGGALLLLAALAVAGCGGGSKSNASSGPPKTAGGATATVGVSNETTGKPTIGSGANASLTSTSTRSDGAKQVTYNGHPLYLFKGDKSPGDANGQGLNAFGGYWYALTPGGDQVSSQPSSSGGGSGY